MMKKKQIKKSHWPISKQNSYPERKYLRKTVMTFLSENKLSFVGTHWSHPSFSHYNITEKINLNTPELSSK